MGRKRWPWEKPRKLLYMMVLIYIYIYIYIMMAHNIKIFFYMKYLMIKCWWVTSYEFVVRIIYLKGLLPHPNVSEFHLLSYFTSFIPPYRYIRGIFGVDILGRQQLRTILWNWGFYYYFMALNFVLENYFKDVLSLMD